VTCPPLRRAAGHPCGGPLGIPPGPPTIDRVSTPAASDAHWLGTADRWARTHQAATDALATLAVAAVLGPLSLSAARGVDWRGGWVAAIVACFVVLHLTVAVRARAPAVAVGVASLAMFVIVLAPAGDVIHPAAGGLVHLPALFLPSSLVFLVLLYSAASRLPTTLSRVALLVGLVGGVLATVRVADAVRDISATGWLARLYLGLGFAVTVLATWGLGRLTFLRGQRRATERAESARLAVLEERARIAREMHDIVAHSLAVIVRQAEGGAFVAEREPQQAGRALQTIADTGRAALTDMRGLLGVLRDPDGERACERAAEPTVGPAAEPRPRLADLAALVSGMRATGIAAELSEQGTPFAVGSAAELAGYRVVQEALTNAVKYAGPGAQVRVTVHWRRSDVAIEVTDDGGDHGARVPVPGTGAGLQGLRERVAAVGGSFGADRLRGGFRVQASFPRPAGGGGR
jgi:signal transduction histidine kinase